MKLKLLLLLLCFLGVLQTSTAQCTYTVDAGQDTTFCTPVNTLQLNATITGTPPSTVTYNWLPTTGLSNPNIANPVATITSSITYIVEAFSVGTNNLVNNGDFSSGNTGFTTDYVVGTGGTWGLLSNSGTYAVSTNSSLTHNNFANCNDHTTGTGNMMVVNGASTANQNVWCQTVTTNPNTYYIFQTWLASVEPTNPASLQFSINGTNLGSPFNAAPTTCNWQSFNQIWFSGTATSAQICIVNQNTNGSGNDFAIDDIIFNEVCVVRDTIVVNRGSQTFTVVDTTICQGSFYFAGGTFQNTAGTYVDVLPDHIGCDSTVVTNLSISSNTISLGNDTTLCAGSSVFLNVGFPGATYLWSDNSTDSTLTVTQSGLYWVEADLGTCVIRDSINITFISAPPLDLGNDTAICAGNLISFDIQDTSIASYQWYNGATTPIFVTGTSDTISAVVTNSTGCSSTDTMILTVYSLPMPNLGADTTLCQGDTLLLDATHNGAVYLWQDGTTTPTYTVTQSGTYSVEVNNGGLCVGRDTIQVIFNAQPPLDVGNDTTVCAGNLVSFDVTDFSIQTYQWNNTATTPILVVGTSGTYAVTVTDAAGCTNSDSATVNVLPFSNVDFGPDTIICAGQTLLLDATFAGATYQWQDNSTTPTYSVTQSGTYSVSVDNGGCISSDTINVLVNPLPTFDIGNDTTVCSGDLIQMDATYIPAVSYQWNTSITTPILVTGNAGTYAVTVTDGAGCSTSDSLTLTVLQRPVIDFGNDTAICANQILVLDATTPNAVYTWQDGANTQNYIVTQAGTYSVNVTNGVCSDGDTINVAVNQLPVIDIGQDTTICSNATYTLDATYPNAQGYLWSTLDTTPTLPITVSGLYSVGVLDQNGCIGSDTAFIIISPAPNVFLGFDQSLCIGDTTTLDATTFNATYSWQDGATTPIYTVSGGGTYAVTVTTPIGCTDSDTINILDAALPIVDLGEDTIVCTNTGFLIDGTTPTAQTYFWQDFSNGNTLQVVQSGNYHLEVTTIDGCKGSDTIEVTIVLPPLLDLGSDTTICASTSITLDANLPLANTYLWQDGTGTSTYTVTDPGVYSVQVIDDGNCISTDTITVQVTSDPPPIPTLPTDITICNETTTVINAYQPNATSYQWEGLSAFHGQNDYTDTVFIATFEGDYAVTVSNGCTSLRQVVSVWKEDCGCTPFVPNAFTPNQDGNNDIFRIYADCLIENYELSIYDRWGQLVYFSQDIAEGWDGNINGTVGQSGVYVWVLNFVSADENGEPITKQMKGDIAIVR